MEIARSIRPVKLLSEGHCDAHDTYKGLRCMDCELWICGMCGVLCHKQCRTILVEEAYEEVKMEVALSLEKELEERNTRIDKINDSLKVLDVKRKELIEDLKNCEKKIEELESLKLKEENLCENVNLVKQISASSSTYEEFSNAKKDIDSLREKGKQHLTIEFQIKLEETAPEETAHEEIMTTDVIDCRSLGKEPKLEKNSEMSEVVKILSKEWGDIPSVNGDDLNKANQNEIMPTNYSDVEMAEPEVDKRKRLSSEGSDSITNSPVKSKKPYRQPLVEQTQNSLNTPKPTESQDANLKSYIDNRMATMVKFMTGEFVDIKIKLDKVVDLLSLISTNEAEAPSSSNEILRNLPIGNVEDYKQFNDTLAGNPKKKDLLIIWFTNLGGNNYRSACRNCLSRTFANEFTTKITFTGKFKKTGAEGDEKAKFKGTTIHQCIIIALQKSFRVSENDINKCLMTWFHHASDREGGRAKRQNSSRILGHPDSSDSDENRSR